MKRQMLFLISLLSLSFMACGGDSEPGFPVGTWELSEITFTSDGASVSTSTGPLSNFKLTFLADNSLTATGTGADQTYVWSYDEATGIISITGGMNVNIEATMTEGEFSYKAHAIADMSATSGDESKIAEFAASSFIQAQATFSTNGSLDVYFKFTKI